MSAHNVLTHQDRSVLIVSCRFEGEEPQINQQSIIALDGASKSYGAVRAARGVSISLRAGEVRALAGENGAGKSTIVRMLAGVQRPDEGEVLVDGKPAAFSGPADARDAGVAVIYQEPTLFPDLSIAENVMMGRHPLGSMRRIDRKALHRTVGELMDRLGVKLDPEQPVKGLSIADQQIVEIAKALSFDARVLIMDEPTAALSGHEVERLFGVVRTLKERGAAILFISHRLDEIFTICDTVTVLRDGEVTHDGLTKDMDTDELVRRMVGRELSALYPKLDAQVGETVLQVNRLTREGVFIDVSFEVKKGEIVALAGLVGAGRSEVARAIFGVDTPDAGHVTVDGLKLKPGSPSAGRGGGAGAILGVDPRAAGQVPVEGLKLRRGPRGAAMRGGVGWAPEARRQRGWVRERSMERNIGLPRLQALRNRLGVIGR